MKTTSYAPMAAKSVLNPVKAPSMPFDWSINPYRGCQHGCAFCYARSTHAYLGEAADDAFQRRIFWKEDAPALLRAQLKRLSRSGRLPPFVAVGTATDPYQQLEGRMKLTRGCLEALAEYGVAASVTTRSPLILRDLDLLRRMPGSSVNISVHSLDAALWRAFEPSSPAPDQRLASASRLIEAGVPATVFMAPMLPYLSDTAEAAEELFAACVRAGVRELIPSFLRLETPEVKSWFFSVLRREYPELSERYGRLYWRASKVPDAYSRPIKARIAEQMARHGLARPSVAAADRRPGAGDAPTGRQETDASGPVQLTLF